MQYALFQSSGGDGQGLVRRGEGSLPPSIEAEGVPYSTQISWDLIFTVFADKRFPRKLFNENFQHPRAHAHSGPDPRNFFNENFVDSYPQNFKFHEIKALYGIGYGYLHLYNTVCSFGIIFLMQASVLPSKTRFINLEVSCQTAHTQYSHTFVHLYIIITDFHTDHYSNTSPFSDFQICTFVL